MGSFLQLLNATMLLKINTLKYELLHLPRKIYEKQTVKAWVHFADCKTESNFAELQTATNRIFLNNLHFAETEDQSFFLLGRRGFLQPVNQSKQVQFSMVLMFLFLYSIYITI